MLPFKSDREANVEWRNTKARDFVPRSTPKNHHSLRRVRSFD
jgi:hypothetical protein